MLAFIGFLRPPKLRILAHGLGCLASSAFCNGQLVAQAIAQGVRAPLVLYMAFQSAGVHLSPRVACLAWSMLYQRRVNAPVHAPS